MFSTVNSMAVLTHLLVFRHVSSYKSLVTPVGYRNWRCPCLLWFKILCKGNHQRQEFRMLALFLTLLHDPVCPHASNDQTFEVRP